MESTISNPIHLPCPDMAGCINPEPSKTANSLRKIRELRERFADQFPKKTRSYIPARFRQGVVA